jgi:hypothetical protein
MLTYEGCGMSNVQTDDRAQDRLPETQIPHGPRDQSMPRNPSYTIPPLSERIAFLLRPLTKEGRRRRPLWYLVRGRIRIGKAPKGSPLGERTRRVLEDWATFLWWPIARVLSVALLLCDRPDPRIVRAYWKAIDAGPKSPEQFEAPNRYEVPCEGHVRAVCAKRICTNACLPLSSDESSTRESTTGKDADKAEDRGAA